MRVVYGASYENKPPSFIEGTIEQVLPKLNFVYDSGYGGQQLFGFIWFKDGTWSERGEYDGSEWWEHKKRPAFDVEFDH